MTTTSSATSGTISSLGVGSGIDANSIVTKLVDLERQPITNLQAQAVKIQAKISAYGQIQSAVSTLRDAAEKLANPAIWYSTTASSSDSAGASITTSSGAVPANYAVSVSSLAASQSVVTKTALPASTSTLGSGTLTFDVGSWSGTNFSAKSGTTPVTVTIAATDTLQNIQDKINGAGAGVTASLVNDASGVRLSITSSTTGAANGFRITASDTGDGNNVDNAGLSSLAYDPATATLGTTLSQTASDATATINGVPLTSSTNQFNNVLTGISLTVGKVTKVSTTDPNTNVTTTTDTPINVSVTQDSATITKAITDFATAYSAMATLLHNDTKYDDATKTAGPLQGDASAVGLLNQFRSVIGNSTAASSVFSTLSSIGLSTQTDGTLTVDSTKLTNAMGNLSEVKKLFANADLTNNQNDGIGTQLRTLCDSLLGFDGTLTTRTAGLNTSVANNQKQQDELDARSALYEARLKAQYSALDTTMAGLNGQSSYITQMITQMNKTG